MLGSISAVLIMLIRISGDEAPISFCNSIKRTIRSRVSSKSSRTMVFSYAARSIPGKLMSIRSGTPASNISRHTFSVSSDPILMTVIFAEAIRSRTNLSRARRRTSRKGSLVKQGMICFGGFAASSSMIFLKSSSVILPFGTFWAVSLSPKGQKTQAALQDATVLDEHGLRDPGEGLSEQSVEDSTEGGPLGSRNVLLADRKSTRLN